MVGSVVALVLRTQSEHLDMNPLALGKTIRQRRLSTPCYDEAIVSTRTY